MQAFWRHLTSTGVVRTLFDFENRGVFFENVHSSYKFCLITVGTITTPTKPTRFGFFLKDVTEVLNDECVFEMSPAELAIVNPVTCQPPVCRRRRDFDILLELQSNSTNIGRECPAWVGLTSAGTSANWVLNDDDSADKQLLDLYEAKLIHQFDHRFATYDLCSAEERRRGDPRAASHERHRPTMSVRSRYKTPPNVVLQHLARKTNYKSAIPCYRDVARSTDERTGIATLVPLSGLMQPLNGITCKSGGKYKFICS
jgi:hypothetical protein